MYISDVTALTVDETRQFMTRHQAKKQITQQEYAQAFKHYSIEANNDNPFAQYYLGQAYEFGLGVDANLESALEWYLKAAENEHANAQVKVGLFYYNAKGGLQHSEKLAREWWGKSVDQNNVDAQFELGLSLCYSKELQRDCRKGVKYLELAATSSKHEKAALTLGKLYYDGISTRQDKKQAAKWFQKAADMGNDEARYNLAVMYQYAEGVQGDINKSIALYEIAGKHGHSSSLYNLGHIYLKGVGVSVDYDRAYELFRKAFQLGSSKAAFAIGVMADKGLAMPENTKIAFRYYEKASKLGVAEAQKALADMYFFGSGAKKDLVYAYAWFYSSNANIRSAEIEKKLTEINLLLNSDQMKKATRLAKEYEKKYKSRQPEKDLVIVW